MNSFRYRRYKDGETPDNVIYCCLLNIPTIVIVDRERDLKYLKYGFEIKNKPFIVRNEHLKTHCNCTRTHSNKCRYTEF